MIIVLDFDHTLFNMMEMHQEMIDAITSLGITREQYDQVYGEISRWKMFTVDAFAYRLQKVTGISSEEVKTLMHTLA